MTEVLLSERARDRLTDLAPEIQDVSKMTFEKSLRSEISHVFPAKTHSSSESVTTA